MRSATDINSSKLPQETIGKVVWLDRKVNQKLFPACCTRGPILLIGYPTGVNLCTLKSVAVYRD